MLYILLSIIAVGILLCSEPGKKILNFFITYATWLAGLGLLLLLLASILAWIVNDRNAAECIFIVFGASSCCLTFAAFLSMNTGRSVEDRAALGIAAILGSLVGLIILSLGSYVVSLIRPLSIFSSQFYIFITHDLPNTWAPFFVLAIVLGLFTVLFDFNEEKKHDTHIITPAIIKVILWIIGLVLIVWIIWTFSLFFFVS